MQLRPILLGGLFKAVGNKGNFTVRAKGAYMVKDLEYINQASGVPIRPPKVRAPVLLRHVLHVLGTQRLFPQPASHQQAAN